MLGSVLAAHPLAATAQEGTTTFPIAWVAPSGFNQTTACVPGLGERWASPASFQVRFDTGVAGPLYVVHQGRLVAIFFEISQADLAQGGAWKGMPIRYEGQTPTIDHVDVMLIPAHPGFEEPHYGIHLFLVSRAEQDAITC
jgi:hypothetical protein